MRKSKPKRTPRKAQPATPPPIDLAEPDEEDAGYAPEQASLPDDLDELWTHIGELHALAKQQATGRREDDPVADLAGTLNFCLDHCDHALPLPSRLRKAQRIFYDQTPAKIQRQVLNGWFPIPMKDRPSRKEIDQLVGDPRRYLVVHTGLYRPREVESSHQFHHQLEPSTVHVLIREGATKREALDGLYRIFEKIMGEWQRLIDEPTTAESGPLAKK
jgi:hypothetical protein